MPNVSDYGTKGFEFDFVSVLYKTFGMLVSDVHVYPVFTTEDKILA